MFGELDNDIVGVESDVVLVASEPLQAGRTGREYLDRARVAVIPQLGYALMQLPLLAESHLGGDVGTGDGERAGFAAAAIAFQHPAVDLGVDQVVDDLERIVLLDRCVTRIMIEVARAGHAFQPDVLLHQVLVNVDEPAAWKDLVELVAGELVIAGTATDHDGLDV